MTVDQAGGLPAGARTRRSRRTLLAGAAATLAAVAAETATRAAPARAAEGDPVLQGQDNGPVTTRTMVFTTQNGEFASLCDNNSHGKGSIGVLGHGGNAGVYGQADTSFGMGVVGSGEGVNGTGVAGFAGGNGTGVTGEGAGTGSGVFGRGGPNGNAGNDSGAGVAGVGGGSGPGVAGTGATGVHGTASGGAGGAGVRGDGGLSGAGVVGFGGSGGNGVEGSGGAGNSTGVWGMGQGKGAGVLGTGFHGPAVHGRADFADAVGVLAENTNGGVAFKATGPASFSRSGVLTVPAGKSAVTKTGVALTTQSLVLATLQQDQAGVWVRSAVPDAAASSFTIHLSKAAPARTAVAWFIVN